MAYFLAYPALADRAFLNAWAWGRHFAKRAAVPVRHGGRV